MSGMTLHEEARLRSSMHDGQQPERRFSGAYEIIGLIAEIEWSKLTGAPRPDTRKIGGGSDGGVDFRHEMWGTDLKPQAVGIDVKGAQGNPRYLLVERGRVIPGLIYVHACVDVREERVWRWSGWATAREVLLYVPRLGPRHLVNHHVPLDDLHPIDELLWRLL